MNRAQKALAENIVLSVRTRTMKWTYYEREKFNGLLLGAIFAAKKSLNLEPEMYRGDTYVGIILTEITDCIRIARTYHDLSAEEIIESLDGAFLALKVT